MWYSLLLFDQKILSYDQTLSKVAKFGGGQISIRKHFQLYIASLTSLTTGAFSLRV